MTHFYMYLCLWWYSWTDKADHLSSYSFIPSYVPQSCHSCRCQLSAGQAWWTLSARWRRPSRWRKLNRWTSTTSTGPRSVPVSGGCCQNRTVPQVRLLTHQLDVEHHRQCATFVDRAAMDFWFYSVLRGISCIATTSLHRHLMRKFKVAPLILLCAALTLPGAQLE